MAFLKIFKRRKSKSQSTSAAQNFESKNELSPPDIGPEQTERVVANSTNPAFQEAWNRHWMKLDKSERDDWSLNGAASPMKVQKNIEDIDKLHRQETVSRRIADPTLRFLRAIETVMAGATIGIQAYPDVSSIVVGVIRVVINVAVKYFEYYEKLSRMLEELVDDIEVLDMFTQNNANSPELHDTLVALYTNILAFCRHARRVFRVQGQERGPSSFAVLAKVQWAPFEEEFGAIRANLSRYTTKLGRVTTAITMNTSLAIKDDLMKTALIHAQEERKDFLNWICKDKIEEIHEIVRKQRLADTGSFIFKNSTYQKWVSEQATRPLWINGAAGTGKSILASTIIDHLSQSREQNNHTVVYVYLKGEDTNSQSSPDRIISMLIKQLCWKLEIIPKESLDYYRQCSNNARLPVLAKLAAIFIECAGCFSRVFAVIDGLDEYEEKFRKPILDFVCATSRQGNSKFLVTSRWEWDIERAFLRIESLIIPDITSNREDITRVVKHRVKTELGHFSSNTQEYIIQQLIEKSNGIFLWITFQLNDLSRVLESEIKTQLSLLPSDLQETYVQIFRTIHNQPATSKALAQRCFLWAFHTEYLLDSHEFLDAIGRVSEHEKIRYNAFDLTAVTKQLIEVFNLGLLRVRPVHFSLREFFMDSHLELSQELRDLIPDNQTANARLATECLRHLLSDITNDDWYENILPYCGSHFDTHIRRLAPIPEEILQTLDHILLVDNRKLLNILTWRWPVPIDKETMTNFTCVGNPLSIDPLFFLRATKLDQIPVIRARYSTLKRIETYPDSYLHVATIAGLDDIVSELIDHGVDPNREDAGGYTALQGLCNGKGAEVSETVVMMLLKAGADPDKATVEQPPSRWAQNLKMENYVRTIKKFKDEKKGLNI